MKRRMEMEVPVEVPEDVPDIYVEVGRITNTSMGIIVDFGVFQPKRRVVTVRVRLRMSPQAAKVLVKALVENLASYERNFGRIPVPGEGGKRRGRDIRGTDVVV